MQNIHPLYALILLYFSVSGIPCLPLYYECVLICKKKIESLFLYLVRNYTYFPFMIVGAIVRHFYLNIRRSC